MFRLMQPTGVLGIGNIKNKDLMGSCLRSRINNHETMTWDLWDPPYIQVASESSVDMQCGCQHEFDGGYGVDLLEETAVNEMACVQVLQILLRKADDEINELEKHLASLQSELACIEYEEWPNICCDALKEKIDYFCVSLKCSRCRVQDDSCAHSNMNEEPGERMHDLVTALLSSYCNEKNQKHELSLQTVDRSSSIDKVDDLFIHSNSDEKQQEDPHPKAFISEPSSTTIKSAILSALRDDTARNGNAVKVCDPKLEVGDDVENGEGNSSAIDRSGILNQPLKLQESTTRSDEPTDATTESTVQDPSNHDDGCNQRTKSSNTVTGALPENDRNPDEPGLSDHMLKIAWKDGKEEPKAALTKKQALPSSSLIVWGENRNPHSENSALTSMVGDWKSDNVMKTPPGEEDEVSTAVKLQDDPSVADKSNSIQSKRPQKQKRKREIEQNASRTKRLRQMEIAPRTCPLNTIGGWMVGTNNDSAKINEPLTGKTLKEFILTNHSEAKHPVLAPDVSAGLVSQQDRERKRTSDTVTSISIGHAQVKMGDSDIEVSGSGCKTEQMMIKHEKSDDLHNEVGILQHPAEVNLESLKVNDLRAIAKEYKLTNFYKLKKKLLVEKIAIKMGRC